MVYRRSLLLFTFLPGSWFPFEGDGLAWGVLVGGLLQMILVWWVLRWQNYLPKLQLKIWSSDIKHVLRNLVPGIAGLGLLQFSTLINLYFASALPGYGLLNLRAGFAFSDNWRIETRVDNVLDRRYELARGFNTPDRSFLLALVGAD